MDADGLAQVCWRCGQEVRPAVRPGPSGAFRMGGTPARCARCKTVVMVTTGRVGP